MGLRNVRENLEVASLLLAHVIAHPAQYPGTEGAIEALDIQPVNGAWRVTVGLGNQGESGVDALVSFAGMPALSSFK
jgi:hypothetical protein